MSWDSEDYDVLQDISTILGEILREIREMRDERSGKSEQLQESKTPAQAYAEHLAYCKHMHDLAEKSREMRNQLSGKPRQFDSPGEEKLVKIFTGSTHADPRFNGHLDEIFRRDKELKEAGIAHSQEPQLSAPQHSGLGPDSRL